MTTARAVAGWIWSHRMLVLLGAGILLALLAIRGCRRVGELEEAASATEERQRAREAGATPIEPVPDVRSELHEVLRRNGELEGALARLRKRVQARPIAVVRATTEPVPVPRVVPLGERLRLAVDSVELVGQAGSHMVVGTAAAFGEDGGLLIRSPWSAPVSVAVEKTVPTRSPGRLALGPLVGLSSAGGALYGAAGTFRLFEVWGWGFEALGTGAAGPGGVSFQGALLVRR